MGRHREGPPKKIKETPAGKLASHLDELMRKKGASASDLAEEIGVTPNAVRKWLNASTSPNLKLWPGIAKYLGLKNAKDLLPDLPIS